jgi:hypothetical protein
MLHFLSCDLDLRIQEVLTREDGLKLCVGSDDSGQQWLLYRAAAGNRTQVWLCAPTSARAVDCVRCGHASVADALRHSLTGLVEIVTFGPKGCQDHCVRGADLPAELLSAASWRLEAKEEPSEPEPAWRWRRAETFRGTGVPAA